MRKWLRHTWRRLWYVLTGDCRHACVNDAKYGWAVEADCPIHDPDDERYIRLPAGTKLTDIAPNGLEAAWLDDIDPRLIPDGEIWFFGPDGIRYEYKHHRDDDLSRNLTWDENG